MDGRGVSMPRKHIHRGAICMCSIKAVPRAGCERGAQFEVDVLLTG